MKTTPFYETLAALLLLVLLAVGCTVGIIRGIHGYRAEFRKTGSRSVKVFAAHVLGGMEKSMPECLRYPMITLNGGVQRMIGRGTVSNSRDLDVIRLSNGHLARQGVWTCTPESLHDMAVRRADAVLRLHAHLQQTDTSFLFVLLPHQIAPALAGNLPLGADDCMNPLGDAFAANAGARGVPLLDIRNNLRESGLSHDAVFFRTDHHLTPEGGLWAYFQIASHLLDSYGMAIGTNTMDATHYDFGDRRQNWFLGSSGKRTGPAYAGVDDICYLVPRFETSLTYEIPSHRIRQSGDFPHAVFFKNHTSRDFYRRNSYAAYLNGDYGYSRLVNHRGGNGKRLLVLKDSFANVITPHLATTFAETHMVDLRYLGNETLGEVIERTAPDIVIWMLNLGSLWGQDSFNYDLPETIARTAKDIQK